MAAPPPGAHSETSPKTSAPPAPAAAPHLPSPFRINDQPPEQAHTPTQTHLSPHKETHSHKSSSGPASHGSSAKESPCTAHCKAQTATRDTCTSPSRHRTTQPTAESPDADTDHASQTTSCPSSSPAAEEPQAASPSPSCPHAVNSFAAPGTNPRRSAPSAAPRPPQLAPTHSIGRRPFHPPHATHSAINVLPHHSRHSPHVN